MCVLSIKVPIRKKSGNLFNDPCIPLWIFASGKLLPPTVNSTLQVFMVFSIKFMTSSDILYILMQFSFFQDTAIWMHYLDAK